MDACGQIKEQRKSESSGKITLWTVNADINWCILLMYREWEATYLTVVASKSMISTLIGASGGEPPS